MLELTEVKKWIEEDHLSISEISRRIKSSRRTISKFIRKNNINFECSWTKEYPDKMTSLQEEILRGTILGDDCLYLYKTCKYPTLMIYHAISLEDYINLKYNIWKDFTPFHNPHRIKRDNGWRLYFNSGANKCFFDMYKDVYVKNGFRRITEKYLNTLTDISLAFWFMDDGSRCKNRGLALHTNNFTLQEVQIICDWFRDKHQIACWPQRRKENEWVVFFSNETSEKYAEKILPYVHPSLRYKLKGIFLKNPQRLYAVPFALSYLC